MHDSRLRALPALPAFLALLPVAFALLALVPTRSSAQLSFVLSNPAQTGIRGQTLSFAGTLTNLGSTTVFLNNDNFTLSGLGLSLDDSPFLFGAPTSLVSNVTYSGAFFTVAVAANAPAQSAAGVFSIIGGPNGGSANTLATQSFRVTVPGATAAPEPGSASLLLGTGMLIPLARIVRRRRKA